MKLQPTCVILLSLLQASSAFVSPSFGATALSATKAPEPLQAQKNKNSFGEIVITAAAFASVFLGGGNIHAAIAAEDSGGANNVANSKIATGGASTLQSGRTITITRGVNLDGSDFSNQNLKGVAFQQSVVRGASFKNSNLFGASFFDATLDLSDFENADMTQANLEMAQLSKANLKNTILRDMYVGGATIFDGVKDIENSDWTDSYLSKYQKKLLCNHPTAKGTNTVTGVDTRESLIALIEAIDEENYELQRRHVEV
eukprot:CAMPEP_0197238924 /NCGR_PEP_ID=MMETSP1429-20130617/5422_1 /TAXON_ID=49237 /ORGANISM="Chaetoceros  sp., Strain UNC1202" /LENGTH=257 /DNA_ID=CAMNT_0042698211 /DNA_START=98 /DNA_END=872 /DNA_ORIENTATION=+